MISVDTASVYDNPTYQTTTSAANRLFLLVLRWSPFTLLKRFDVISVVLDYDILDLFHLVDEMTKAYYMMMRYTVASFVTCVILMTVNPTDAEQVTVINSTPLVSNSDTLLSCLDAAEASPPSQLTVGRLTNAGELSSEPIGAIRQEGDQLQVRWGSEMGESRRGVFFCSGSEPDDKVITFKIYKDALIQPERLTVTVSLADQVSIVMSKTGRRQSSDTARWSFNGVEDALDPASLLSNTDEELYVIGSVRMEDAGIYEVYPSSNRSRGGFMRLIVRGCAEGKWGTGCQQDCPPCVNGGVCDDESGACICPPGFMGVDCEIGCGSNKFGPRCESQCKADSCQHMHFSLPDPFGSSCGTGWSGLSCDFPCADGHYGAGCTGVCTCPINVPCDRFTGDCICPPDKIGPTCQDEKYFFMANESTVTLGTKTRVSLICGCHPSVTVCPATIIEILRPTTFPDEVNQDLGLSRTQYTLAFTPYRVSGPWQFKCILGIGQDIRELFLNITAIENLPVISMQDMECNAKDSVSFTCDVTNVDSSDVKVRFFAPGSDPTSDNGLRPSAEYPRDNRKIAVIDIVPATRDKDGIYTCQASGAGGVASSQARLTVREPPVPTLKPTIIKRTCKTVTLKLHASAFSGNGPVLKYSLEYKQSQEDLYTPGDEESVPSDDTVVLDGLHGNTEYTLRVVFIREGGNNFARGAPGPPVTFFTFHETPTLRPIIMLEAPQDISTELQVTWRENPPAEDEVDSAVILYKIFGDLVDLQKNVTNLSEMSAKLMGLKPYTQYSVAMRFFNCARYGRKSARRILFTNEGAPSSVTNLAVDALSHDRISVSWEAPEEANGEIRSYEVSYLEFGSERDPTVTTVYPPRTSEVLTGLRPHTTYLVTVTAVTMKKGEISERIPIDTKEYYPEGLPLDVKAVSETTSSIRYTWAPPQEDLQNGNIIKYEYMSVKVDSSAPRFGNTTQTEVTISGLERKVIYQFHVRAYTAVGPGPYSETILGRTLEKDIATLVPTTSATVVVYTGKSTADGQIPVGSYTDGAGVAIIAVSVVVGIVLVTALAVAVSTSYFKNKRRNLNLDSGLDPNVIRFSDLFRQTSRSNEYDDGTVQNLLSPLSIPGPRSPGHFTFQGTSPHSPGSPKSPSLIPSYWYLPWNSIIMENIIIAEGNFGQVVKAVIKKDGVALEAAVKTLKAGSTESDRRDFIGELDIMCMVGSHPNIVSLIGATEYSGVLYVATEYAQHGNLLNFLRQSRLPAVDQTYTNQGAGACASGVGEDGFTSQQLLQFAADVTKGMQHLSEKGCVHRDLAARNVLVCDDLVCKVTDFGLSRSDEVYVKTTAGRLPVRWMAIESLNYSVYTTKSDVWSFGILLWEIVSLGATPYPGITCAELYERLPLGYRMEPPLNCDEEVYNIMRHCWRDRPHDRPTFEQLNIALTKLTDAHKPYVNTEILRRSNFDFAPINSGEDIIGAPCDMASTPV